MLLLGLGIWKDEATVKSMSRFGDYRFVLNAMEINLLQKKKKICSISLGHAIEECRKHNLRSLNIWLFLKRNWKL